LDVQCKRIKCRILSVFMTAAMIAITICGIIIPVSAADFGSGNKDVVFKLSTVSGKPGDTVEVELTVTSAVSYNSVALSKLNYDKAALEFVGFTTYSDMENKCYFPGGFDSANTAIALALKTSEALNGFVCKLQFVIADIAAAGDYTITMQSLIKENSKVITSDVKSGCVTVEGNTGSHTHTLSHVEAVSGTCTAEGILSHWYCSGCRKYYSDKEGKDELNSVATPVVAENHAGGTGVKNAKDVTAVTDGYTGDTYCLGCKKMIKKGEVIPALGEDSANVVFALSNVAGKAGDTVEIDVTVNSLKVCNSVALYQLTYDANVLEFGGFSDYTEIENKCYFPGGFDDDKQAIVLALKTTEKLSGYICKIKFLIKDTAAVGDYVITMESLVKENSTEITSEVEAGIITVKAEEPVYIMGDIDGNGKLEDNDVRLLAKYFAGWPASEFGEAFHLDAGDMDGDGTVTRKDAMILARKNAGWTTNTGE